MRIRQIYYSSRFEQLFRKLPRQLQARALITERYFRLNPFHPSLRTHKLHGKLEGSWGISITGRYRIIFKPLPDGDVLFVSVGPHSIYSDTF